MVEITKENRQHNINDGDDDDRFLLLLFDNNCKNEDCRRRSSMKRRSFVLRLSMMIMLMLIVGASFLVGSIITTFYWSNDVMIVVLPLMMTDDVDVDSSINYYNKGLHDEHCPALSNDKINVHIIAHSHDDVGWLKTVDQYFYGDRNDIQRAGVQYVIDSVVQALDADPNRRYVQVEMAFLARWWHRQNDVMKNKFRRLLRNGQLEIVCGGWSMADEATPDYVSLIDQHTIGFDFIRREIDPDYRPLIAWQVDPFGHSRELASLSAEMGMNGLFFARLDYQDRQARERNKTTELVWKLRPSTPEDDLDLFTSVLARSTYCPPDGFNFDVQSDDVPIMDDPQLDGYNADRKALLFGAIMKAQRDVYPTRNLLVTMGCDFNFLSASTWFLNMDALIRSLNNITGSEFNAFYSTPSCYTRAVHDQLPQSSTPALATKRDDFFPYADSGASFWTGYFSSRPSLKKLVRDLGNAYGTVQQLLALNNNNNNNNKRQPGDDDDDDVHHQRRQKMARIEDTLGIMQHHDGISGTSRQHVTNDARKRSATAIDLARNISAQIFDNILCQRCNLSLLSLSFCPLLNESLCQFTEANSKSGFSVVVYNRLAETLASTWLRLPLSLPDATTSSSVTVIDSAGLHLPVNVVPIIASDIGSIPSHHRSTANVEVVFKASDIPPLGTSVFFVQPAEPAGAGQQTEPAIMMMMADGAAAQTIDNGILRLTLDSRGRLSRLENTVDKVSVALHHELAYYTTQLPPGPTSGAYRFTPDASDLHRFGDDDGDTVVLPGDQVTEIHRRHSSWAKTIYRLYRDEPYLETQWVVGPIPVELAGSPATLGREVVSLFETSISSDGVFYTDANGREMLERRRDFRPTWQLRGTQNVSQNYYPIVSRLATRDAKAQLTLVTDRAQGASGFRRGSLEVMVHRRLSYDDHFGVEEPLMETEDGQGLVATGRILVLLNAPQKAARCSRKLAQSVMFAPSLAFSAIATRRQWQSSGVALRTSLGRAIEPTATTKQQEVVLLPANIHLLTLQRDFDDCSLLLRLEHLFEVGEDAAYSADTQVPLLRFVQSLLGASSSTIEELSLGANMPLGDLVRLKWPTTTASDHNKVNDDDDDANIRQLERRRKQFGSSDNWETIVMRPMQIRTFCVKVKK